MNQEHTVIERIWKKKTLLENNDPHHKTIKPLLLILGGGNLGVYGAAACYALQMLGLGNIFDTVIGISTGAWVGGYYLAGLEQIKIGTSIYYEDFASPEYITARNFPFVMNRSIIESATSRGQKKLDIRAVQNATSNFFVGVTDLNGKGHFLDAKKAAPSLWSALYASSATPLAYAAPCEVNSNLYIDGGIALTFPIKDVVEQFAPTDVLVLPNCPREQKHAATFCERAYIKLFLSHLPYAVRARTLLRHEDFCAGALFANNARAVQILWPPNAGIRALSKNPQKLREAAYASARNTLTMFGKSGLAFELY